MDTSYETEDSYISGDHRSKYPVCDVNYPPYPLEFLLAKVDRTKFEKNLERIRDDFIEARNNKIGVTTITEEIRTTRVDSLKSTLKAILTENLVEEINMSETEGALIYILNKIFDGFFAAYEELTGEKNMLVFKGGNVTRLFFDDLVKGYFPTLSSEAYQEFGKYFKKSDLDFSVEDINADYSELSRKEKIKKKYKKSNVLMPYIWYILNIARLCIATNAGDLYNFCKFNLFKFEEEISEVLDRIIQETQDNELFEGIEFIGICFNEFTYMRGYDLEDIMENPDRYQFIDAFNPDSGDDIPKFFKTGNSKRKDVLNDIKIDRRNGTQDLNIISIEHENLNIFSNDFFNDGIDRETGELIVEESFEDVVERTIDNHSSEFYVTVSPLIQIPDDDIKFRLMRLMINYVLIYVKDGKLGAISVPSEMYDVGSTIEAPESGLQVPDGRYYDKYTYSFVDVTGRVVYDSILITSVFSVVLDLIKILFIQGEYPWDDKKYEKRIIRLAVMSKYIELNEPKDGFLPDDILGDYILPLKDKILGVKDDEEASHLLKKYETLVESFEDAIDTLESYLNRSNKRRRSVSRIGAFGL